jgi:hypothetical protein
LFYLPWFFLYCQEEGLAFSRSLFRLVEVTIAEDQDSAVVPVDLAVVEAASVGAVLPAAGSSIRKNIHVFSKLFIAFSV